MPAEPLIRPMGALARGLAGALVVLILANALTIAPIPLELRFGGAYLLTVLLPGWLAVRLALGGPRNVGRLAEILLAVGLGSAIAMLLGLAVFALARPAAAWHLTLGANAVAASLVGLAWWRRVDVTPAPAWPGWAPVVVLAVAGALRLADLGWSEFQGDEARVLLRAMAALQGYPDTLAAHRKVPGEILLTLVLYGQLGSVNELVGRLPFVLAAVGGVLALYELGREAMSERAGLIAALLVAINGYYVAFGRILQYDSLAFLLGTLALLCCYRYGRGDRPQAGLALLGSALLFGALLTALGSVFFLAPALLLIAPRLRGRRRVSLRTVALWCWPVVPAVAVVVLVLAGEMGGGGPGGVLSYLAPRLGGDRPYWNASGFLRSANHYLSTPYAALMLLAGGAALLVMLARRLQGGRARLAALAVTLALVVAAASWQRPAAAFAIGAGLILLLVFSSSRETPVWQAAVAWAAVPLFVHLFLIRVPGTHWREAFPGLALLAAGLAQEGCRYRWGRVVVTISLVGLVAGSAHYNWLTLVQRWPEYQMVYPEARHPLDWAGSDGRGVGGVFGVSHRHGWKALAALEAEGTLSGSFATNESPAIAAWYLRRPQGCPEPPDLVYRTPRAPQDRALAGPVRLPANYTAAIQLTVQGQPTITVLAPVPAPSNMETIEVERLSNSFDRTQTSPWRPVAPLYRPDLGAAAARQACAPAR